MLDLKGSFGALSVNLAEIRTVSAFNSLCSLNHISADVQCFNISLAVLKHSHFFQLMRNVWLCILFTESFIKDAEEVGLLLKD